LLPLVYLLWMYRGGALAAVDDPVAYVQHFTGDWALWLLLADLTITPVRRLHTGLSWLIRLRRMVGLWAFFYATVHLLSYVLLFSGYDMATAVEGLRAGHLGEPWRQLRLNWPVMLEELKTKRFLWAGLAAWTILLALAVTSPLRVLRAMGGKNWQRLHRLVYLAAWLAVTHYWWMGKNGSIKPWKVTVVLVVLLLARLVWWVWRRTKVPKTTGAAEA